MTKLFSTLLWVLMVPLSRFIGMAIREGTSSCGWTIGLLTKPSELILTIHRYCNLMVGVSPQKCKLQRIWINSFELFCSEKVLWVKVNLQKSWSMVYRSGYISLVAWQQHPIRPQPRRVCSAILATVGRCSWSASRNCFETCIHFSLVKSMTVRVGDLLIF
ncbi:uncharacterized protein LOC119365244 [Triticum dicoccoides]|uniref:uncharacterized protein LOC119365244 n=1 Tax=Triticum dicoccoides TaxID=85692 RepID=UPI00188EAAD9|nr:uncharacterized protein LOC119365244 [Triticum dicoccoides]